MPPRDDTLTGDESRRITTLGSLARNHVKECGEDPCPVIDINLETGHRTDIHLVGQLLEETYRIATHGDAAAKAAAMGTLVPLLDLYRISFDLDPDAWQELRSPALLPPFDRAQNYSLRGLGNMPRLNLPEDLTGWSVSIDYRPAVMVSAGLTGTGKSRDISDSVIYYTLINHDDRTIELGIKRFTESAAGRIKEILDAWTKGPSAEAPSGVADQMANIFSRLDFAKVKEDLELIESLVRLLIKYGGPAVLVIEELLNA